MVSSQCQDVNNLNLVVDGQTCFAQIMTEEGTQSARQKAVTFCQDHPDQIKTTTCSSTSLGSELYGTVAATYCDSDGKSDDFCACYNAFARKCDRDDATNYAGCTDVNQKHSELVWGLPEDASEQIAKKKYCRNNVCKSGSRFKPSGSDECRFDLQLCINDARIRGNLQNVGINVKCNQSNTDGAGGKGGAGTGGDGDDDEDKKKGVNKVVVGGVSSVLCVLAIGGIAAATMM